MPKDIPSTSEQSKSFLLPKIRRCGLCSSQPWAGQTLRPPSRVEEMSFSAKFNQNKCFYHQSEQQGLALRLRGGIGGTRWRGAIRAQPHTGPQSLTSPSSLLDQAQLMWSLPASSGAQPCCRRSLSPACVPPTCAVRDLRPLGRSQPTDGPHQQLTACRKLKQKTNTISR